MSEQIRHGRVEEKVNRKVEIAQHERDVLQRVRYEPKEIRLAMDLLDLKHRILTFDRELELFREQMLARTIRHPDDLIGKREHEERDRHGDEHYVYGSIDFHALQVVHLFACAQYLGLGTDGATRVAVETPSRLVHRRSTSIVVVVVVCATRLG